MQSLTYEERTELLNPSVYEDQKLIQDRLSRAVVEYMDMNVRDRSNGQDVVNVEDFCCWLHNETAAERDVISGHSNPRI